jgi:mannosyltransferase OCH1-like enzyme
MLAEGGLYLDDDLFPVVSLDLFAVADKNGLLLVEDYASTGYWGSRDSNDISVWQAFIGSAWPGHPFFQCALRTVVENVLTHTTEKDVLFITGPHALRVCTKNYMFRFQLHANWPNGIAKNKSHAVVVHKAFPARAGRDRHYSKYATSELVVK